MNLLDSINILAGLREASEEASRSSFSLSGSKSRNATLKRKAGVVEDGEESSVAPSPRPGGGSRDRLGVEKKEKRGGSVPSTREVSVKIEDGAESVASSVEGSKRESSSLLLDCTLPFSSSLSHFDPSMQTPNLTFALSNTSLLALQYKVSLHTISLLLIYSHSLSSLINHHRHAQIAHRGFVSVEAPPPRPCQAADLASPAIPSSPPRIPVLSLALVVRINLKLTRCSTI